MRNCWDLFSGSKRKGKLVGPVCGLVPKMGECCVMLDSFTRQANSSGIDYSNRRFQADNGCWFAKQKPESQRNPPLGELVNDAGPQASL